MIPERRRDVLQLAAEECFTHVSSCVPLGTFGVLDPFRIKDTRLI